MSPPSPRPFGGGTGNHSTTSTRKTYAVDKIGRLRIICDSAGKFYVEAVLGADRVIVSGPLDVEEDARQSLRIMQSGQAKPASE